MQIEIYSPQCKKIDSFSGQKEFKRSQVELSAGNF